jgi:nitrite reductase/ring-hydroxylating ferredoxin subunit
MCIVANDGVVAVYNRCWFKIILHIMHVSKDRLICCA